MLLAWKPISWFDRDIHRRRNCRYEKETGEEKERQVVLMFGPEGPSWNERGDSAPVEIPFFICGRFLYYKALW